MAQGDNFAASVGDWVHDVEMALEAIFKESVQQLIEEVDQQLTQMVYNAPASPGYRRTGFLRSSAVASKTSVPLANRPKGAPQADYMAEITVMIAGSELGETIYLGYTAEYGPFVHYGANGRPGRPWVTLVAQRWGSIVASKEAELRSRLGL